jgi:hypothetical protein
MHGIAHAIPVAVAELETAMTKLDSKLSRRKVFAGAGAVGALAAVATAVPLVKSEQPQSKPAASAPDRHAGGYQLTEHVKQYYRTARV